MEYHRATGRAADHGIGHEGEALQRAVVKLAFVVIPHLEAHVFPPGAVAGHGQVYQVGCRIDVGHAA